ncbi:hypothetical protein [Enterovirga sp. CN4-39]|uniref:hypothetical protein n=1 Tax=Enterovirga sp. CN4-39 TaxID=3400910 RepID=UPI003C012FB9
MMKRRRTEPAGLVIRALLALAVLADCVGTAQADVVTVCRSPAGKSIYQSGRTGWQDDGIADATITIRNDALNGYHVRIKSPANDFSARDDGARIRRVLGDDAGNLTISAEYPLGAVEIYQIALNQTGSGSLIMAVLKNGAAGVTKGSLFTASCARP